MNIFLIVILVVILLSVAVHFMAPKLALFVLVAYLDLDFVEFYKDFFAKDIEKLEMDIVRKFAEKAILLNYEGSRLISKLQNKGVISEIDYQEHKAHFQESISATCVDGAAFNIETYEFELESPNKEWAEFLKKTDEFWDIFEVVYPRAFGHDTMHGCEEA